MEPRLEGVEAQAIAEGDGEFAIEDEVIGRDCAQRLGHLGEEPMQRLARLGEELHRSRFFHRDATEAVPFGFEHPAGVPGKVVDEQRLHGLDG